MYFKPLFVACWAYDVATAKSYLFKSLIKLGVPKKIQSYPLVKPPEKSCSTAIYKGFPCNLKISWVRVWRNQFQNHSRAQLTWAPARANQTNLQSKVKRRERSIQPTYQPTSQATCLVNTSEQAMQSKSKSCLARTSHSWADQPANGHFIAVILVSCWHQQSNNQAESKEKQANKQSSEQAKQSK